MGAKTTVLKITNITALVTKSESIFSLQTATEGFIEDCNNKIIALKERLSAMFEQTVLQMREGDII